MLDGNVRDQRSARHRNLLELLHARQRAGHARRILRRTAVTLYDGEDIGPRTVVIRYGAEPSSAIMKLIVVSVVELPELVRVAMLAVALLP